MKIVVVDAGYPSYKWEEKAAREAGAELVLGGWTTKKELMDLCRDAEALTLRQTVVDREVIGKMKRCRIVARYGIGVDNVDLAAAAEKKIYVTNVKHYCYEEVAEQAFALLLAAARKVIVHDRALREGLWDISTKDPIHRIKGRTLGIVGLGQIPRRLVEKVKGLQLRIVGFDPYVSEAEMNDLGVEKVELDRLLAESDFVSLHAAVTKETRHMIGEKQLRSMKPSGVLVNTSRGALIDEAALFKALSGKWIDCACLDVYETEPLPKDSPLRKLSNCILTDHCSWYSEESIEELQRSVAEQVAIALKGEEPPSVVNKDLLAGSRP